MATAQLEDTEHVAAEHVDLEDNNTASTDDLSDEHDAVRSPLFFLLSTTNYCERCASAAMLTYITYQDTFEDATDSTRREDVVSPNPSTRSLTQRSLSLQDGAPTSPDAEEASEKKEHISNIAGEVNGNLEESDVQKNHTVENKDGSTSPANSPPLKGQHRPSRISVDDGVLDNVDLEGETDEIKASDAKGRYHSL